MLMTSLMMIMMVVMMMMMMMMMCRADKACAFTPRQDKN